MRPELIPKTPAQMTGLIHMTLMARIYGDITTEARRRGMTDDDITAIEERAIELLGKGEDFAGEFETFQAEIAVAAAVKLTRDFLAGVKSGREQELRENT
jgi:hypothetical protein